MSENISIDGELFYVLVSGDNELVLFGDKNAAIAEVTDVLAEDDDATVAQIEYRPGDGSGDQRGTFEVNPISWKDIALGAVDSE